MKFIRLWWELRRTGATSMERAELAKVANELQLPHAHLSKDAKVAIAEQIGFTQVHHRRTRRVGVSMAFALFAVLFVAAQFTQAGSPLYALKRGTQNVRAIIQPSYKQELEQERAQDDRSHDSTDDSRHRHSGSDDSAKPGSDDSSDETRHSGGSDDNTSRSGSGDSESSDDALNDSGGSDDSGSSNSGSGSSRSGSSGSGRRGSDD